MEKKQPQQAQSNIIEEELSRLFSSEWLREKAKETGFIKRERKIDPVLMFWTLVLGFGVQLQRTLAQLRRLYEERGEVHISRGSFYERFSPELVTFLYECVLHGLENIAQGPKRALKEKLQRFKDLVFQDSTVVRVSDKLAYKWPATRSRKVAAGVKVGMLVSAAADGPSRVALFPERTNEIKTLKIGPWVKDRILLIDLGFYKHQSFTRIRENGGFFITRLKGKINPTIISSNRNCRGRSIDLVGKKFRDIESKLKREVLDVNVEIPFMRRTYRGKKRLDVQQFRLVAVYNAEAKAYHSYLTNIPTDDFDAKEIATLYSARWEIELIFKELKSRYGLDVLPTANPDIVKALIWVGILTLIVSRRVYTLVYSANMEKAPRYTHLRWATIFAEKSHRLLDAVLAHENINAGLMDLFDVYKSQALDPNVNRTRLSDAWRA
jgi:putative transposase